MPLLKQENPRLAQNLSEMAMSLRQDAEALKAMDTENADILQLRQMPTAHRSRALAKFLKENGVPEPERSHIRMAEALLFSEKPSAWAAFPGGVIIGREYDRLVRRQAAHPIETTVLQPGEVLELPELALRVHCVFAEEICNTKEIFTVNTRGPVLLRSRQAGDAIRLNIGTQTLKKLFVDRKIPAALRESIPVFADDEGVLAVGGIGANVDRLAEKLPAVQIRLEMIESSR